MKTYNVRIVTQMAEVVQIDAKSEADALAKANNLTDGIMVYKKNEHFDGVRSIEIEKGL